ncbi:MAG: hypothetical protein RL071_3375, partial [Pseudomonadota bacterium]
MTASHFDPLPIPAFALAGEGKIVSWNHAMAALSGVEASGLLGQGVRALPLGGPVRTAIFEALQGQAGTVKVTAAAGGDQPFLVQPLNGGEDGVVLVAGASTAAPRVDGPV